MIPLFSIIIPLYNEEKRVSCAWRKIEAYFHKKMIDYEVVLVDDGSIDNTAE